ncbi:MAG: hypothetical protein ACPGSC_07380 [Granulosicoccaceae bacterium]
MEAKSLATLCIRLLALYTIWRFITHFPLALSAVWSEQTETDVGFPLVVAMAVLMPLLLSALMYAFSAKLAGFIVSNLNNTASPTTPANHQIHAIAISTAGLVMFLWTLPKLLSYLAHNLTLEEHSANLSIGLDTLIVPLLQCLFSLTMVFGAAPWTNAIRGLKTFGLNNK